ncbi:Serine/threonine protein kinase [Forsythia ovata]|uniref:Serine/threonine protein kinase n=1 Tax=Forsythia ovata TaxID=205694 RepID=A0ABD1WV99_9LAMI
MLPVASKNHQYYTPQSQASIHYHPTSTKVQTQQHSTTKNFITTNPGSLKPQIHPTLTTTTTFSSFGNLTNLEELMLSSNNISGSIPASLSNATSLIQFHLDANQISGLILLELGFLTQLTVFFGSIFFGWGNKLEESIPTALAGCRSLQALDLSHNALTCIRIIGNWQTVSDRHICDKLNIPLDKSPLSNATHKFSSLDEGSLINGSEFGWFTDFYPTSTMLESPILTEDRENTDSDMAMIFTMREEDESLFADLDELPECSTVFRCGKVQIEVVHRWHSLVTTE